MLQTIQGEEVFVVDFDTMPELPITWSTDEEKPYALALATAIHEKVITEPGKYGIRANIDPLDDKLHYDVFKIIE